MEAMNPTVFPAFRTTDADRTIALLEALGFTGAVFLAGKISPRDAGAVAVDDALDDEPTVAKRPASSAIAAG